MFFKFNFIVLFFVMTISTIHAQKAILTGTVVDDNTMRGVDLANVYLEDLSANTQTDQSGQFELAVDANKKLVLVVSRIGFKEQKVQVSPLKEGKKRKIRISLIQADLDVDIIVKESKLDEGGMIRENLSELKKIPSTTGNLESVLPSIALGLSSGTGGELSSQYNVRGGNYDENLVYVNDFEIYRPQLIRTGQQEGLTFANLNLAQSLVFSSGGFESKYGDKLSSVLDVRYKRPEEFNASISASALGASVHVEGSTPIGKDDYRKFRYLIGGRYKTTRYLLTTLDIQGEYVPDFYDFQGYFTYDLSRSWQVAALLNFNQSNYTFVPQKSETGFGLSNVSLRLSADLEGQEKDDFLTGMGGVSFTYVPDRDKNPMYLKFLGSGFHIREVENFDIVGAYMLSEVESGLGSDRFGTPIRELGTGIQQRYIRNRLYSNLLNFTHLGGIELQGEDKTTNTHFVQWGATIKQEDLADRINEWERLDSVGFSLPYDPLSVQVFEHYKAQNTLKSVRLTGFLQNTWTIRKPDNYEIRLNTGLRGGYWTINKEFYITPRAQLLYKPLKGNRDLSYRLATGLYYQPPFYRELRTDNQGLNRDLKSQKSFHVLAGMTYDFNSKKRGLPYRFIAEVYYKNLWDVVSYEVDNVRIRYSGENDATGYVAGLDMRINGEFVKGVESWANISFLRARENLIGIQHKTTKLNDTTTVNINDVARPTDQLVTASVFLQDYFPNNENFQVNLTATVGSGLPYGFPNKNRIIRNPYRYAAYKRLDVGFSAQLWKSEWRKNKPNHILRSTKAAWVSLEVFNVLGIKNEASKTWVKTIFEQQYAIPNRLSGRRINLKATVEF